MNKIYCHFDHYKVKKKVTKHSIEQIQSIIDYQNKKKQKQKQKKQKKNCSSGCTDHFDKYMFANNKYITKGATNVLNSESLEVPWQFKRV